MSSACGGRVTARQSSVSPAPARVLVAGSRDAIARAFPAIAPLQPVGWREDGLVCAPRAAADGGAGALARCPLPVRPMDGPAAFPTPPSAWVAGWYRRGPDHAPAPPGVRELVQVDGEGFGAHDHPTTAMCLEGLPPLPSAPALDVGCGSGLLAQAWVALGRGPAEGIDLDPRAIRHARDSAAAAGRGRETSFRAAPVESLARGDLDDRVLLVNIPARVHLALVERLGGARPRAAVLSGLRADEGRAVVAAYGAAGLRAAGVARRGGWERWTMVRT